MDIWFTQGKEIGMNTYPYNLPIYKDDRRFIPRFSDEFDSLYLMALAAKYRADQIETRHRARMYAIGSWLITLGLRIKYGGSQPHLAVKHVPTRLISAHNRRAHHRG